MRTMRAGLLIVTIWVLAPVSAAWAVGNLSLKVQDPGGNPVQATLTITPEDAPDRKQEVTTDPDGTKTVELPPGVYWMEDTSDDNVRTRQRVTVVDGQTTSEELVIVPIVGWMVQVPPTLGGFGIGPLYLGQWGEPGRRPGETTTITAPGFPPTVLRDASAGSEFDWSLNVGALEGVVGLPRLDLPATWPIGHIFTGLHLKAGGADATIDVTRVDRSRFSFDGSGPFVGAGFELVAVPCDFCGLFFGLGYQFDWADLDLEVSDCAGGLQLAACSTSTDGDYYSHTLTARVGHSFWRHRIAPYGGIRWQWSRMDLDTTSTLTGLNGVPVGVRTKLELEQDELLGVLGVDARIWGPVFVRAEVAFNDETVSAFIKLIWGFGFVRPISDRR